MTAGVALRRGFAQIAERPSAFLAEFAWRWAFGTAISVLLLIAAAEYLDSIEIFSGHVFADAGTHFFRLAAVLVCGIVLLAVFATAAGRNAILLQLFASDTAPGNFRALLWLNFLRAVLLLAAVLATIGVWLFAALVSGDSGHIVPLLDAAGFWLVFCPITLLVWMVFAWLYWIVTLASLPAVLTGMPARDALAAALEWFYERPVDLGLITIAFGFLRLVSVWAALQLVVGIIAMRNYSRATELGLLAVIAAMYCLLSDYLFVSRMGAYASLIQNSKCKIRN